EGETLEARVHRDGPIPVSTVLDIAEQVARALAAAEKHGLVHRDLKPSNIMLVAKDVDTVDRLFIKVIDFGLAKAVAATEETLNKVHTSFSGTPGFASPEQLRTDSTDTVLDGRSDIYSLGVTLWFLLCGKTPFTGRSLTELRAQQHSDLPIEQLEAIKVSAPLIGVLRSMLATDPAERPQSARELLGRLQRCREMIEVRPRRRRRLEWAAVALALIVVL